MLHPELTSGTIRAGDGLSLLPSCSAASSAVHTMGLASICLEQRPQCGFFPEQLPLPLGCCPPLPSGWFSSILALPDGAKLGLWTLCRCSCCCLGKAELFSCARRDKQSILRSEGSCFAPRRLTGASLQAAAR